MSQPACCPACAASGVQGQLVPKKSLASGLLVEWLTGDSAAALMAMQMGDLIVVAFCVSCGAQWVPGTVAEHRLRALSGQLGERAKREAEEAERADLTLFNCPGCTTSQPHEGSVVTLYGARYCAKCAAAGRTR
jgi:hypothetical protein